jgi:hypothetical protein
MRFEKDIQKFVKVNQILLEQNVAELRTFPKKSYFRDDITTKIMKMYRKTHPKLPCATSCSPPGPSRRLTQMDY